MNLINSTSKTLEQLENYKNETILFEQQKVINQVTDLWMSVLGVVGLVPMTLFPRKSMQLKILNLKLFTPKIFS